MALNFSTRLSTTTVASLAKMPTNSSWNPNDMVEQIADFDTDVISQTVRLVSWFLQFLTYTLLVYVLVEKSPKEMGTYRWYILINSTHAMFMRTFDMICQPFRVEQTAISMSHGVCKYLHSSKFVTLFVLYFDYLLMTGFIYTLSLLFVFRYVQTAGKLVRFFSNMYNYFVGYVIFQMIFLVAQWVSYDVYVWTSVDMVERNNPVYYNPDPNISFIIGFNATSERGQTASYLSSIFLGLVPTIIAFLSIAGSYWVLRDVKQRHVNLQPAVKSLYMKLLIILLLDVLIFIVFGFIPNVISIYIETGEVASMFLALIPEFYPLLINLILFVYIKPYRECIVVVFRKCFKDNSVHSFSSAETKTVSGSQ